MSRFSRVFIAGPENDFHPPVLSYKAFLAYALLLLIIRLILGAVPAQSAAVDSQKLMELINDERKNRNLTTLLVNSSLLTAADSKSQDMIDRDYFAHIDPDGKYVWPRIEAAGYYPYKTLGENLALDFATSEGMIKAWIDSPSHRANLLNPDFVDQGLSALYGDFQGRYTNLTTSLFGALAKITRRTVQAESSSPPPPAPDIETSEPPPQPEPEPKPSPAQDDSVISLAPNEAPEQPVTSTTRSSPLPIASYPGLSVQTKINPAIFWSRIIFTLFGIFLLTILCFDSFIIYRHELAIARSRPAYHLFGFILITLVSILIWWW